MYTLPPICYSMYMKHQEVRREPVPFVLDDRKVLVLAGNHQQFELWCEYHGIVREARTSRIRYISQRAHVMGYDYYNGKVRIVKIGTYWDNPLDKDSLFNDILLKFSHLVEYSEF